jgi:hypothetical protein
LPSNREALLFKPQYHQKKKKKKQEKGEFFFFLEDFHNKELLK